MAKKGIYTCLKSVKRDGVLHAPGSELELTKDEYEEICESDPNALAIGGASEAAGDDEAGPSLKDLSVEELEARAEELEIDLGSIEGSGAGGNVVEKDLVAAIEAAEAE